MNKLFIIGLPRTGTTSVSVALLDYGFKVAHTAFTKRAFELADVISDAPCFCDYAQLDGLFPGSKFIYLDRCLDSWLPSIQMLLGKMRAHLDWKDGGREKFQPLLKRCFQQTFALSDVEDYLDGTHLERCYLNHKTQVFNYFDGREDFLSIDISQPDSFKTLLDFIGIVTDDSVEFPHLNEGRRVASWDEFKHVNKISAHSAGVEHRKYFDY